MNLKVGDKVNIKDNWGIHHGIYNDEDIWIEDRRDRDNLEVSNIEIIDNTCIIDLNCEIGLVHSLRLEDIDEQLEKIECQ